MSKNIGRVFHACILFAIVSMAYAAGPDKNVRAIIYGAKHVFAVATPDGWVLDREFARQAGLPSFFYPENAQDKTRVHIYAAGYDKTSPRDTLNDFIVADIKTMKKRHPQVQYKKKRTLAIGSVLKAETYLFTNMQGFYKEYVNYLETKDSIITIVFSTKSRADHDKYLKDFDALARSFVFLSSDPADMYEAARKAGIELK